MKSEPNESESNKEITTNRENLLSSLRPSKSFSSCRSSTEPGVMTIVNSKRNGRRIALAKELLEKLNNPESLQVSFTKKGIAFAQNFPGCENRFTLKKSGTKGMIYSYNLVKEIIEEFSLDFTGRTCLTFSKVTYLDDEEPYIALVKVKRPKRAEVQE